MIRIVAKFLKILNSESDPVQISLAFCLAMIMGFTPILSPHNLLVLLLVLLLRVNLSAFILGFGLFSGIAYLLDPLFHKIGLAILDANSLGSIWTALYNSTIWRVEKFNNTVVMGSLLFSLIFFVPLLLFSNLAINRYREYVFSWIQKTRVMKLFKATKFYRIYNTVSVWGK